MKVFTDEQKEAIQHIYNDVVEMVHARYGEEVTSEDFFLSTDPDTGSISSIKVGIVVDTPPDVDGESVPIRKEVELWE